MALPLGIFSTVFRHVIDQLQMPARASALGNAASLLDVHAYRGINAQTGTSYTPTAAAALGFLTTLNNASAIALSLPNDATEPLFVIGTRLDFMTLGAGQVTNSGGSSRGSALKSAGQGAFWTATKTAANTWWITGDLTT